MIKKRPPGRVLLACRFAGKGSGGDRTAPRVPRDPGGHLQRPARPRRLDRGHLRAAEALSAPGGAKLHAQGVAVSRKHVSRLVRSEGPRARVRKRYRCPKMSDHDQPVTANLPTTASRRSGPTSAGWATSP